jgi:hypothetical protein
MITIIEERILERYLIITSGLCSPGNEGIFGHGNKCWNVYNLYL